MCFFFRSEAADTKACSNNNNPQIYKTRDRGDPGVIPFLDDVHVTTGSRRDDRTRKEGQTKQNLYDAYQNHCKCIHVLLVIQLRTMRCRFTIKSAYLIS